MLIEAFSEAKDPSAPEANEDRFAILPGRAFAVIDGVTDRLGTRYNGMLSGQYPATIVKGPREQVLAGPRRRTIASPSSRRCRARSLTPIASTIFSKPRARIGTGAFRRPS